MRTPLAVTRFVPALGVGNKVTASVLDSRENVPAEVFEGENEPVAPKVNTRSKYFLFLWLNFLLHVLTICE